MTSFAYRGGALCADAVSLATIAEQVGTPFYVYSQTQLRANYRLFYEPFADLKPLICYAIKASQNTHVARTLVECGAGVDVTSGGELERALKAGASPQKIIYSGVGKTREEITKALALGIFQLNVESIPELRTISAIASEMDIKAPIALRVNPNVIARTHHKIATGELGTKFGIDAAQLEETMGLAKNLPGLEIKGFQVHIGSHLFDYENFREAYGKLADMLRHWRLQGFDLTRLDLGGGVGIPYDGQTQAPFSEYASVVRGTIGNLGCEIAFEPGRRLVGDAGALVARVLYDKQGSSKRFLILDAGMNDLIRPAMYEARHSILPIRESKAVAEAADVVGPVCETSDLFGDDYLLPGVGAGDFIAIMQAGAYGAAMASMYNGRSLIPEIMVSGDKFWIIRRRISSAEQISWEAVN